MTLEKRVAKDVGLASGSKITEVLMFQLLGTKEKCKGWVRTREPFTETVLCCSVIKSGRRAGILGQWWGFGVKQGFWARNRKRPRKIIGEIINKNFEVNSFTINIVWHIAI